jgi:hypothetical protein
MLFSFDSLATMFHGIAAGGMALMGLFAALFWLYATRSAENDDVRPPGAASHQAFAVLMVLVAVALWVTVLGGTYIVFPTYRTPPPEGVVALVDYPRAYLLSDAGTAWLHAFAMESKEHMPWIASMLATSVAFVATRERRRLWADRGMRSMTVAVLAVVFGLVSFVALMGVLVNKVAPVQ